MNPAAPIPQPNSENLGEMRDADAVGTVGNPECGEMMRLWVKYKQEQGREVIEKASFQAFGCETAIAVASLATQTLKGRTREEALALGPNQIAPELGPLPPMKIHCAELVQAALRAALAAPPRPPAAASNVHPVAPTTGASRPSSNLLDNFTGPTSASPLKIVFLDPNATRDPEPRTT